MHELFGKVIFELERFSGEVVAQIAGVVPRDGISLNRINVVRFVRQWVIKIRNIEFKDRERCIDDLSDSGRRIDLDSSIEKVESCRLKRRICTCISVGAKPRTNEFPIANCCKRRSIGIVNIGGKFPKLGAVGINRRVICAFAVIVIATPCLPAKYPPAPTFDGRCKTCIVGNLNRIAPENNRLVRFQCRNVAEVTSFFEQRSVIESQRFSECRIKDGIFDEIGRSLFHGRSQSNEQLIISHR